MNNTSPTAKIVKVPFDNRCGVRDYYYYAMAHACVADTNINVEGPYRLSIGEAERDLVGIKNAVRSAAAILGA